MEDWTKYVLDNVENEKVLHYCTANLRSRSALAIKALAEEKNQLATELVTEMSRYLELLDALDGKMNGNKKTTVIA